MRLVGSERVSDVISEHAPLNVARLKAANFDIVREEKASGKSRDGRSELETVLSFIRPGDTLVVVKMDRLGKSTRDVLNLVHELDQKGAALRVLEHRLFRRIHNLRQ
jgi:DNA invertase Pin-like site-specific DNA recombinase